MGSEEIISIIIIGTLVFSFFCFAIVAFVLYYMKGKKLNQQKLESEILKAEINSIEQTSKQISRELHDNIVQHLSAACILLQKESISSEEIKNIHSLVNDSVTHLHDVSLSLTAHHIEHINLNDCIEYEIKRYRKIRGCEIYFKPLIETGGLNSEKQLMLFRIFQESLSNSIKHAKANKIIIELEKVSNGYQMLIKDNGVGFDIDNNLRKNGLFNIMKRADIINARLTIDSTIGKGTTIQVISTF